MKQIRKYKNKLPQDERKQKVWLRHFFDVDVLKEQADQHAHDEEERRVEQLGRIVAHPLLAIAVEAERHLHRQKRSAARATRNRLFGAQIDVRTSSFGVRLPHRRKASKLLWTRVGHHVEQEIGRILLIIFVFEKKKNKNQKS